MTDNVTRPEQADVSADESLTPGAPATKDAANPGDAGTPSPGETLQAERDRYYDLMLRKTAEFDNYRRRVERERREQGERVVNDLLLELLPVVDDLERALKAEAVGEQAQAYRTGVDLIYRQMLDLLKRRGVKPFDSLGTEFDPNLHQAVVSEHAPGRRDGEVIEEFCRGYMAGERLLRPAMVKVARA